MSFTNDIKVLGARALVKEIKMEKETKDGIIIPGRDKQKTNKGIVLKVGDGAILENGTVVQMQTTILGQMQTRKTCSNCHGTGKVIKEPCEECRRKRDC